MATVSAPDGAFRVPYYVTVNRCRTSPFPASANREFHHDTTVRRVHSPTVEASYGEVAPISYETCVHSDVTAVGVGFASSARLPKKKNGVGVAAGAAGSAE
jgi:hypothetical protein